MMEPSKFTRETILQRKAEARIQRANLSFGEKMKIVEGLRERMKPFRGIRERLDRAREDQRASKHVQDGFSVADQDLSTQTPKA